LDAGSRYRHQRKRTGNEFNNWNGNWYYGYGNNRYLLNGNQPYDKYGYIPNPDANHKYRCDNTSRNGIANEHRNVSATGNQSKYGKYRNNDWHDPNGYVSECSTNRNYADAN
jgi:hypothetical protein